MIWSLPNLRGRITHDHEELTKLQAQKTFVGQAD